MYHKKKLILAENVSELIMYQKVSIIIIISDNYDKVDLIKESTLIVLILLWTIFQNISMHLTSVTRSGLPTVPPLDSFGK